MSKVHLSMPRYSFGNPWGEPSICGQNPRYGTFDIRTTSTFFHAPVADQCSRCVKLFAMRGNNIDKLRADAKLMPYPSGGQILEDRQKAGAAC